MKTNKFYKLNFTEHNGEQEYDYHYLIPAKSFKAAMKIAKEYIENWYEDGKWADKETCGYDGSNIQVEFEGLEEITPALFAVQLLNSYSIGITFDTDVMLESKTDCSIKIKT